MASFTSQDLGTALGFPFKDPRWTIKLAIATAIMLAGYIIPVFPWIFVYGYVFLITQRIIAGGRPYLPEWENWSNLALKGLKLLGAMFIYGLPAILPMGAGFTLMFGSAFIEILREANESNFTQGFPGIMLVGNVLGWAFIVVAMIVGLVFGFLSLAAASHMVAKDSFPAAFDFKGWWPILRANLGGFILTYLFIYLFSIVLSFAVQLVIWTIVLICLVPLLMPAVSVYILLFYNTLAANAYRQGALVVARKATVPPESVTPAADQPGPTTSAVQAARETGEPDQPVAPASGEPAPGASSLEPDASEPGIPTA